MPSPTRSTAKKPPASKRISNALTHEGVWSWGDTKVVAQFDRTENEHLVEGLMGGPEGQYQSPKQFTESTLKTGRLAAEANIPFTLGAEHVVTVGTEYTNDHLDDQGSMTQASPTKAAPTYSPASPPAAAANPASATSLCT